MRIDRASVAVVQIPVLIHMPMRIDRATVARMSGCSAIMLLGMVGNTADYVRHLSQGSL